MAGKSGKGRTMENKRKNFLLTGVEGGACFSVAVLINLLLSLVFSVLLLAFGATANEEFMNSYGYTYLNFIVSPVAIIATVCYTCKKRRLAVGQTVGLRAFDKRFWLILALLFVGCTLGLSGLNTAFVEWLNLLVGYEAQPINLPSAGFGNFLLCTLIVCLLPAVFEELLFRGLVLNGCKRLGDVFATLLCGALFCLYHHSPNQTPYQFILGCVFVLLAIKSGSIIPSVIFHFLNNFYVIVGYFIWGDALELAPVLTAVLIAFGLALLALGLIFLIKSEKPQSESKLKEEYLKIADLKEERKAFVLSAAAGVVVCVVLWISELVTYIG